MRRPAIASSGTDRGRENLIANKAGRLRAEDRRRQDKLHDGQQHQQRLTPPAQTPRKY
jgi:hypothetical protein